MSEKNILIKRQVVYERDIWLIFVYNNPFMILMISEFKKESNEYKLYKILFFPKILNYLYSLTYSIPIYTMV